MSLKCTLCYALLVLTEVLGRHQTSQVIFVQYLPPVVVLPFMARGSEKMSRLGLTEPKGEVLPKMVILLFLLFLIQFDWRFLRSSRSSWEQSYSFVFVLDTWRRTLETCWTRVKSPCTRCSHRNITETSEGHTVAATITVSVLFYPCTLVLL